jgi:formiminotetrahydrofolate cyclodeaminase
MVRACAQAAELLEEMEEKGSVLLLSDVGCGALLCRAAMESAALNVFVNTKSLQDRAAAQRLEEEIDGLLAEYLPRTETVARRVAGRVRGER